MIQVQCTLAVDVKGVCALQVDKSAYAWKTAHRKAFVDNTLRFAQALLDLLNGDGAFSKGMAGSNYTIIPHV